MEKLENNLFLNRKNIIKAEEKLHIYGIEIADLLNSLLEKQYVDNIGEKYKYIIEQIHLLRGDIPGLVHDFINIVNICGLYFSESFQEEDFTEMIRNTIQSINNFFEKENKDINGLLEIIDILSKKFNIQINIKYIYEGEEKWKLSIKNGNILSYHGKGIYFKNETNYSLLSNLENNKMTSRKLLDVLFTEKFKIDIPMYSFLQNLIQNSSEANSKKINIILEYSKEFNSIKVIDNGEGIFLKQLDVLFLKGYSTKPKETNSGIGLYYLFYDILHNKNNKLEIMSKKDDSIFKAIYYGKDCINSDNIKPLKIEQDFSKCDIIGNGLCFKIIQYNNES